MPALAIFKAFSANPGMVLPGIWKLITSRAIAFIVAFGAISSAAFTRFR
jgi:hypothetical protein